MRHRRALSENTWKTQITQWRHHSVVTRFSPVSVLRHALFWISDSKGGILVLTDLHFGTLGTVTVSNSENRYFTFIRNVHLR